MASVPAELHVIEAAAIHKVWHIPCCSRVGLLDKQQANFIMLSATNNNAVLAFYHVSWNAADFL